MHIYLEYGIIAIVTAIASYIAYKVIYNDDKQKETKQDHTKILVIIIISSIIGVIGHLIIKKTNIDEMYCRKVCYGNKCMLVCKI
jgi:prolipoprotein diacylglyceryltransferase